MTTTTTKALARSKKFHELPLNEQRALIEEADGTSRSLSSHVSKDDIFRDGAELTQDVGVIA